MEMNVSVEQFFAVGAVDVSDINIYRLIWEGFSLLALVYGDYTGLYTAWCLIKTAWQCWESWKHRSAEFLYPHENTAGILFKAFNRMYG